MNFIPEKVADGDDLRTVGGFFPVGRFEWCRNALPAFQGLNPAPMGLEDNNKNVPLGLFLVALPNGFSWKFCWASRTMEGVLVVFPLGLFLP